MASKNLNKKNDDGIGQVYHGMTKLRIFIACADKRLRTAMFLLLDQEPAMVVVGIIDQLLELLPQLKVVQPDVLLLEWESSSQSMVNFLTDIRSLEHPLKVIFFSNNPEDEEKVRMDGVDYYICKNAPPDSLLPILQKEQASKTKLSIEKEELRKENINQTDFANRISSTNHKKG
jgi:DNA-binding NarL/FixJ family response regulator